MTSPRHDARTTASELLASLPDWFSLVGAPERSCVFEILELVQLEAGTHLLDIGCGSGHLLATAASREPSAVLAGVDPDLDAIEVARSKMRHAPSRVGLYRTRAESLPFESDAFDVVTATMVVRGLARATRTAALAECRRVLMPGGRLVVAEWQPLRRAAHDVLGTLPALVKPATAALRVLGVRDRGTSDVVSWLTDAGFEGAETVSARWTVAGAIEITIGYRPVC